MTEPAQRYYIDRAGRGGFIGNGNARAAAAAADHASTRTRQRSVCRASPFFEVPVRGNNNNDRIFFACYLRTKVTRTRLVVKHRSLSGKTDRVVLLIGNDFPIDSTTYATRFIARRSPTPVCLTKLPPNYPRGHKSGKRYLRGESNPILAV